MADYEFAADPLWWSPMAGIPTALWVDPLTAVDGHGRGTQVPVRLTYRSGAQLAAVVSSPAPGVLRCTTGAVGPPIEADPQAVVVADEGGAVAIEAAGVSGRLGRGGLATTAMPRPGAQDLTAPERSMMVPDEAAVTGRLMHGDRQVGWLETIVLGTGSQVYGGGENFQSLGLRGRRRRLLNVETNTSTGRDQAYLNVPLVWSTDGWAILANTGGVVGLDVGASQQETLSVAIAGGSLDLLVFGGPPAQILATHWSLTGAPAALPDWAFGVWMSRATYISEDEVAAVLDDLEAHDALPDVVHVDAWLAGNVFRTFTCEWQRDRRRFPDGWTDRLRGRGVRSSVWLNPFVLAGSEVAEELRERGLLLQAPDGTPATTSDRANRWIVDFTHPAARQWWHQQLADLLESDAPDALKLDFAEEIPFDAITHDGRRGSEIRNLYARLYQAATADAMRQLRPAEPVPLFCRSGTHGSQANPLHWVGDSPATWDGLAAALYSVQSLAMSGFGMVAHDAGGFITAGTGEIPTERLDGLDVPFTADVEPELYARWVQWGAMTPAMRLHGLGLREPTAYPRPHRDAAIAAFHLRRRIAPWLAQAYRAGLEAGLPLLRPMPLQLPEDRAARDADLQYFLGPDVLVAPLLAPGGTREFYLPPGQWTNLFDGTGRTGGGWRCEEFDLDSFPAFARRGSAVLAGGA